MTKNLKLGIIIGVGAIVAAASYYFLIYVPANPKEKKHDDLPETPPAGSGTGPSPNTGIKTSTPPSVIGKVAYANQDNVGVLKADGTIYKRAAKGEWIGTVMGTETKGGYPYYKVSGSRYVSTGFVTLK